MKRHNKIHQLLSEGKATIGTHVLLVDPLLVEMIGYAGAFDYVELVAEYNNYSYERLDDFCRAAELHGLGSIIKIDWEEHRLMAQRGIGAGFEGVLFADARSRSDVEDCVRSVRADAPSPNRGVFGAASRRRYNLDAGSAEFVKSLDDTVVAIMIEKELALKELEEILATPGLGMVQWGPCDYAMSIGAAGEPGSSERLRTIERKVLLECQNAGVPFRAECENLEDARYYADLGVRHFCYGWDVWMLHEQWRRDGNALRGLLEEITDPAPSEATSIT